VIPIGEGLAGRVAAERRPFHQPRSEPSGHAQFAVPMIEAGELIGVAQMGSRTAPEFSDQDRMLFAALARRAGAGIVQHVLRATAERREIELAESEARFRATFEHAGVGMAHVALDGTWLRLNRQYCDLLGYDEAELRQMRFHDVTHPDDLDADLEQTRRLLAGEIEAFTMEKRYLRRDGSIAWASLTGTLVRDAAGRPQYFIAAAQDIGREVRTRQRLALLAEASALFVAGGTGILERVVELPVPAVADCCMIDVVGRDGAFVEPVAVAHRDPTGIDAFRASRRRPLRSDARAGVLRVLATGEPEWVPAVGEAELRDLAQDEGHLAALRTLDLSSYVVVPLIRDGQTFGTLALADCGSGRHLDAEDLAFAQELAGRVAAALENVQLLEERARAVELRDRILAIVSHDLRNPLSAIDLGALALRETGAVNGHPAGPQALEAIRRNVARMARLIGDLADLASLQSGRLTVVPTPQPLPALLAEAVAVHTALAREKWVAIRAEPAPDVRVVCDRDRVLQVLSNLIGNAVKFSPSGATVTLAATVTDGAARISVTDAGPGIAPADQPRVFDLYWQGERRGGGRGLGLFISRGIVEAQGGRIGVDSAPGAGSTFWFTLPIDG
jgi:PAS domain S-box-containing protein